MDRGLKRKAAAQVRRETMAKYEADGAGRTSAAKRAMKMLASRPAPVPKEEEERRQEAAGEPTELKMTCKLAF